MTRQVINGVRELAVIVICVVVGLNAFVGCAPRADMQVPTAGADEPYQFESEGQVTPPDLSTIRKEVDRVDVFEEIPVSEDTMTVQSVEPVQEVQFDEAVRDSSTEDSAVLGPGYRVQVFATGNREAAQSFKGEIEGRLDVRAYVELVDGIFKVRVGDCRSRPDAENLLQRCRGAGYTDAWIVSSYVVWRRPPVQ